MTIGRDAYVGSGTTVTKDVPPEALAIGRARQENKEGYAAKLRFARDTSRAERDRRVAEVLEELAMTRHADTRTASLSGGAA